MMMMMINLVAAVVDFVSMFVFNDVLIWSQAGSVVNERTALNSATGFDPDGSL